MSAIFQGNVFIQAADSPAIQGVPMNYTGKDINATAGSRTQATTDLQAGDVLVLDPNGQDTGFGWDLANGTSGFEVQPVWVVTFVPSGSERGGPIEAVPLKGCAQGIQCAVKANCTICVTGLCPTTFSAAVNQRYLVAYSTAPTTAVTTLSYKGIAGQTIDTSSKTVETDGHAALMVRVLPGV